MKLVNRDTDYAIRAVCRITEAKSTVLTTVDLSFYLKVPRPILRKVLGKLRRAGILTSCKGKKGGFCLSRSAKEISVLDVLQAVQGPFSLAECFLLKDPCPRRKVCLLKTRLNDIESDVREKLRAISIASIL